MRRLIAAVLLAVAAPAAAIEYELPVEVETEDDLYELLAGGEIGEDTFNVLVELLRRGVDLSTADSEELYALPSLTLADVDAIVKYREAAGGVPDPGALVAAGVLSDEKIAAIAPFVVVSSASGPGLAATGRVRFRSIYTGGESRVPPMALEGRLAMFHNLTVGADLLLTRNSLGDVRYDQGRDALSADGRSERLVLPKAYVMWKTPTFQAIAGSYVAGFAQRLTFDETIMVTPNGIYPDAVVFRRTDLIRECSESTGELGAPPCSTAVVEYATPDFDSRETLFGLALSAPRIATGAGWLQLTGFGSAQSRDIYQYEIYDRGKCADPRDDSDDDCKAPEVFERQDDPGAPAPRFKYFTLPGMFIELLGGGNVSWFAGRRTHVGVTGYGASNSWRTGGIDLDFQEYARFPRGGPYGAVGGDVGWGQAWADVGVEVTRTFDSAEGGGLGAIARGTATWPRNELELSLRWYDDGFVNPHTGAIAEPDELDGQRARDEAGVRVRYAGLATRRLSLRALADFWVQPSLDTPKIRLEARGDLIFTRQIQAGAYARWVDKDLRESGVGQCYDITVEVEGEPVPCKGQTIDLGLVGTLAPARGLTLKAQGQLRLVDDNRAADGGRRDVKAWVQMHWWATRAARITARLLYDLPDAEDDVPDKTFLENRLWVYLQLLYRLPRTLSVSGRYELRQYLNEEERGYVRDPSPEHWVSLELEARF